jgi:tartrate-resistant acid phosphatase type 5
MSIYLKRMKKYNIFFAAFALVIFIYSCSEKNKPAVVSDPKTIKIAESAAITSKTFGRAFNFIIIGDWGRNGVQPQQKVADQMEKTADSVEVEFIATVGDNFQISGVASTQDPLWMLNFENVYRGISLQTDWYPVMGNHDYKGNTQAEIDYSKISRRWNMKDRNYTFAKKINDSISARFIFLDTPPLIAEYRNNPEEYPDAVKQDIGKEIKWLKDVLSGSKEQWILVFGHHPIYSASKKHGNTQEMIDLVKPLLEQYKAQFYFCGHDHDFQHLHEKGKNLDYIVTGTGSETRPASTNEMSLFSKSESGFTVVSFKSDSLRFSFVGSNGNILYSFARSCNLRQ